MMNPTILSPSNFISMPWRNGLGTTIELLKQDLPGDAGFSWRLSMADVTIDGEFSDFSGYDRTLLLIEGNGITLDAENGQQHKLNKPLDAAHFGGEDNIIARLHDGPIKDFNVMANRRHCSASVQASDQHKNLQFDIDADIFLIYAAGDDLLLCGEHSGTIQVPAQHLLVSEDPGRECIEINESAFIAIEITYLK